MIIKIDMREQALLKVCESIIETNAKYKDIQLLSENLPLGDIIINDGTSDCIIIERKSMSDLACSIKDGRYEEQSYRLNGLSHHNHNIIYLIEGDLTKFTTAPYGKNSVDRNTLYSAMFSINYFKGFSVMRSFSITESAAILVNMCYKLVNDIKKGKKPYYSNSIPSDVPDTTDRIDVSDVSVSEKNYCSVVKKVKKENVTVENIGEIMLCQIPGVSSASAIAILSVYKTLPALISAIQEDVNCLSNICTTDSNGKARRISKTTITTIINFLKN